MRATYTCTVCEATAELSTHREQGVVAFFPPGTVSYREGEHRFPKDFVDWREGPLASVWAVWEKCRADYKHKDWVAWLQHVFYDRFPELQGREGFTSTQVSSRDCPREALSLLEHREPYLEMPAFLKAPVYPPQAPDYKMFYRSGGAWMPLDNLYSRTLEVPEHPVVTHNRNTFQKVFRDVEHRLGIQIKAETTENRYDKGRRSWYTFQVGNTTFTVGWRKRVIAVEAVSQDEMDVRRIRERAVGDKTTYAAYGPQELVTCEEFIASNADVSDAETKALQKCFPPEGMVLRKGGYHSNRDTAHMVEVHAWKQGDLVEYLTLLGQSALEIRA